MVLRPANLGIGRSACFRFGELVPGTLGRTAFSCTGFTPKTANEINAQLYGK